MKFKCWHIERKQMFEVFEINFKFQYIVVIDGVKRVEFWENEVELLQYTGFDDKTGRRIYEGDIIRNDYGDIFEVKWRLIIEEKEVEIIGNKFENPEL